MLAFHHQRQWSQARVIPHPGAIQHRAARTEVDLAADVDPVDLHHPVFEQVGLRTGQRIEFTMVANVHAIELGDVGGVHVHALANVAAEQAEGHRQPWRAAQVAHEVGHGNAFVHIGDAFGQPDERRPHRLRALLVAAQQQPLEGQHEQVVTDAVGQPDQRQVGNDGTPVPCPCDGHQVQHHRVADRNHHRMRRHDAEGFDQRAAKAAQQGWPVGQMFRVAADLLARRQANRGRAEPRVAGRHALVVRGVGVHAHQHALRQNGAVRDVAAVADERTVRHDGRLHRHPAAIDMFVAQHHGVGDEGFIAQRQHVRHHAQRGGDLGIPADLGAQQAVPERRVHGGIDAVQDVQARLLDVADQPLLAIGVRVDGVAARLDARQKAPADRRRHQHGQEHQHGTGRQGQHEVAHQLAFDGARLQPGQRTALVEPVDQHEAREHGHEEQRRNQQDAEDKE